jgi:flagellar motility protein MotE (MotC chaperone)
VPSLRALLAFALAAIAGGALLLVPWNGNAPASPGKAAAPAPAPAPPAPDAAPGNPPAGLPAAMLEEPACPPAGGEPRDAHGTPATLTGLALRDELRRARIDRRDLDREREALAAERKALEARAAELAHTRDALKAETTRLEGLLGGAGAGGDGSSNVGAGRPVTPAGLESLARAAKGMKPEEMAAVLGRLEPIVAADVLVRMRPADAGAVLAKLPPEQAANLASAMTRRPAPRGAR